MNSEETKHKTKIKKLLAEYLGLEIDDINDEDLLREELHMGPVDIVDFSNILSKSGVEISESDWRNIEAVSDIYEY